MNEGKRFAVVSRVRSAREVAAYLPENYRVHSSHLAEPVEGGKCNVVIAGEDVAGWTLDGYVLPRLASGCMWAVEYASAVEAVEYAAAAMN